MVFLKDLNKYENYQFYPGTSLERCGGVSGPVYISLSLNKQIKHNFKLTKISLNKLCLL